MKGEEIVQNLLKPSGKIKNSNEKEAKSNLITYNKSIEKIKCLSNFRSTNENTFQTLGQTHNKNNTNVVDAQVYSNLPKKISLINSFTHSKIVSHRKPTLTQQNSKSTKLLSPKALLLNCSSSKKKLTFRLKRPNSSPNLRKIILEKKIINKMTKNNLAFFLSAKTSSCKEIQPYNHNSQKRYNQFNKYDTEKIRYQISKEYSKSNCKDKSFLKRNTFYVDKFRNKDKKIDSLLEEAIPRLPEKVRIKAFNRLISDANRRLEERTRNELELLKKPKLHLNIFEDLKEPASNKTHSISRYNSNSQKKFNQYYNERLKTNSNDIQELFRKKIAQKGHLLIQKEQSKPTCISTKNIQEKKQKLLNNEQNIKIVQISLVGVKNDYSHSRNKTDLLKSLKNNRSPEKSQKNKANFAHQGGRSLGLYNEGSLGDFCHSVESEQLKTNPTGKKTEILGGVKTIPKELISDTTNSEELNGKNSKKQNLKLSQYCFSKSINKPVHYFSTNKPSVDLNKNIKRAKHSRQKKTILLTAFNSPSPIGNSNDFTETCPVSNSPRKHLKFRKEVRPKDQHSTSKGKKERNNTNLQKAMYSNELAISSNVQKKTDNNIKHVSPKNKLKEKNQEIKLEKKNEKYNMSSKNHNKYIKSERLNSKNQNQIINEKNKKN